MYPFVEVEGRGEPGWGVVGKRCGEERKGKSMVVKKVRGRREPVVKDEILNKMDKN